MKIYNRFFGEPFNKGHIMSFSDLRTEPAFMRDGNENVLNETDYSDSELIELEYTSAIDDLELDLRDAMGINIEDSTTLDTVIAYDEKKKVIQKALAYLQLKLFYKSIMGDEGSGTFTQYQYYSNKYGNIKKWFPRLKLSSPKITSSTIIHRCR